MSMQLGELLVRSGVISDAQRRAILAEQEAHGRPFGVLAEEMFGVDGRAVEAAWATQFAACADWVDPSEVAVEPRALATVERRQAWQFRVVPMRFEGRELVLATDEQSLPRAMRFVGWRIGSSSRFVLAEASRLDAALKMYYPMGAFEPSQVDGLVAQLRRAGGAGRN